MKRTQESHLKRVKGSSRSPKEVMVEKLKKIDIFGQNGSYLTYKLPKNTLLQVKKTKECVCKTVKGSSRSPKKVIVEKLRNFNIFRENLHFWPKRAFFLVKTT